MLKLFQRFGDHLCPHHQGYDMNLTLMMETEMIPEMLENFNHLTWWMAREDFITIMQISTQPSLFC
jgi:hypothetical protein